MLRQAESEPSCGQRLRLVATAASSDWRSLPLPTNHRVDHRADAVAFADDRCRVRLLRLAVNRVSSPTLPQGALSRSWALMGNPRLGLEKRKNQPSGAALHPRVNGGSFHWMVANGPLLSADRGFLGHHSRKS